MKQLHMSAPMGRRDERTEATTRDPRWASIVGRHPEADGTFFYAVETTGVYCRPSCGARTPRPENISFHKTAEAAERAGYRACKRCKPSGPSLTQQHATLIATLCRFIDTAEGTPTLRELADVAAMSPYHLHRIFKTGTGLTPRAYAIARRAKRARTSLENARGDHRIAEAIYEAGFGGTGNFYAGAPAALGMTPSEYRARGRNTTIRFAVAVCSLGSVLVAATEKGICSVLLGDAPSALLEDLQRRFKAATLIGADASFEKIVAQVVAFVEKPQKKLELPLDLHGSMFQARVWRALARIPPGKTATYTDIAKQIGSPASVRAVAAACSANPVAVLVPCHRVVRIDGGLAGYRWGIERKQLLLHRENT